MKEIRVRSWVEKIPGGRNGNPLQYSCLDNPNDRGAWWATVQMVAKESATTEQLSTQAHSIRHAGLLVFTQRSHCIITRLRGRLHAFAGAGPSTGPSRGCTQMLAAGASGAPFLAMDHGPQLLEAASSLQGNDLRLH